MAWNAILDAEIQVKKPVKQLLMQKVKDDLDYLYGISGPSSGGSPSNGSFEIDSDSDGVPDGWTKDLYPGGSGAFETTNPAHGAKAWKFIHPGGAGNGGGYLTSDYVEIAQIKTYVLGFIHWASVAGMKNQVYVRYYDKDKIYISETQLYSSTANPTSPTYFIAAFTPPANARYIKVRGIGGYTDTNVAGTAYFDDIELLPYKQESRYFYQTEVSTDSQTWVDIASKNLGYIPAGMQLRFLAETRSSGNQTAYIRFRIGSVYSNEASTEAETYVTVDFTLANFAGGPNTTIYMQIKGSAYTTYGRKSDPFIQVEV